MLSIRNVKEQLGLIPENQVEVVCQRIVLDVQLPRERIES